MDPRLNFSPSILIMVRWEEEDFPMQIPLSATVMQVKFRISQEQGIAIPADRQELSLENGTWLQSDEMTVQQYGISHGSVLTLLRKIAVTIRIADQYSLGLIVNEEITVATLKDYLYGHGVDIENKALEMKYEGNIIVLDDRSYLWAAGIEEGTCLSLV
ncbi:hypothetical protein ABKV19_011858 [Rosa sericea]